MYEPSEQAFLHDNHVVRLYPILQPDRARDRPTIFKRAFQLDLGITAQVRRYHHVRPLGPRRVMPTGSLSSLNIILRPDLPVITWN